MLSWELMVQTQLFYQSKQWRNLILPLWRKNKHQLLSSDWWIATTGEEEEESRWSYRIGTIGANTAQWEQLGCYSLRREKCHIGLVVGRVPPALQESPQLCSATCQQHTSQNTSKKRKNICALGGGGSLINVMMIIKYHWVKRWLCCQKKKWKLPFISAKKVGWLSHSCGGGCCCSLMRPANDWVCAIRASTPLLKSLGIVMTSSMSCSPDGPGDDADVSDSIEDEALLLMLLLFIWTEATKIFQKIKIKFFNKAPPQMSNCDAIILVPCTNSTIMLLPMQLKKALVAICSACQQSCFCMCCPL